MATHVVPAQPTDDHTELAVAASFEDYDGAERAVDRLSDVGFPVEHLKVVGEDLVYVEDVTGRRGLRRAALEGAAMGAVVAGALGVTFGLLNWFGPLFGALVLGLFGVLFGAAFGALAGMLVHELSGSRRDFSSVRTTRARRYNVVAPADVAAEARTMIAR